MKNLCSSTKKKTTVGMVDTDVLAFTAGEDIRLDYALIEADCLGSAAHVTMLSKIPVDPPLFTSAQRDKVIAGLSKICALARKNSFEITLEDQDVHLAIERWLTEKLGVLGKRIHTGRSRNDQVATALRIYTKQQLSGAISEAAQLALALLRFAKKHERKPMVGRTHLQPAMPSSVGLWAASFAESVLDDILLLTSAFELNDQCPLGAAASYGVPLPLDREMTANLLGFSRPTQTVLYAITARGKMEAITLSALSQTMLSLSRLSEDLILFSMPEFDYFNLPEAYCTGSSIMPQKQNPDVLELIRGKTSRMLGDMNAVCGIIKCMASGYNRDVQETKEPLMKGMDTTRASLRIMTRFIDGLTVNSQALLKGFLPGVYATDRALDLVAQGMPFRDAYQQVKEHLGDLENMDPKETVMKKQSLGSPGRLELGLLMSRANQAKAWSRKKDATYKKMLSKLLNK